MAPFLRWGASTAPKSAIGFLRKSLVKQLPLALLGSNPLTIPFEGCSCHTASHLCCYAVHVTDDVCLCHVRQLSSPAKSVCAMFGSWVPQTSLSVPCLAARCPCQVCLCHVLQLGVPAKSLAPSDAERRAQAAESRLKQQSQQPPSAEAQQAQQGDETKPQHAQQASKLKATQAQQAQHAAAKPAQQMPSQVIVVGAVCSVLPVFKGKDTLSSDISCRHTMQTYHAEISCRQTMPTYHADMSCRHIMQTMQTYQNSIPRNPGHLLAVFSR